MRILGNSAPMPANAAAATDLIPSTLRVTRRGTRREGSAQATATVSVLPRVCDPARAFMSRRRGSHVGQLGPIRIPQARGPSGATPGCSMARCPIKSASSISEQAGGDVTLEGGGHAHGNRPSWVCTRALRAVSQVAALASPRASLGDKRAAPVLSPIACAVGRKER